MRFDRCIQNASKKMGNKGKAGNHSVEENRNVLE